MYLEAVETLNDANDAIQERYRAAQTLPKLQELCAKLAETHRTFDETLLAIAMPDDAQAAIDELVRFDAAAGANLQTCAGAESLDEWDRAWALAREGLDAARELSNLIRLRLGLPPVSS